MKLRYLGLAFGILLLLGIGMILLSRDCSDDPGSSRLPNPEEVRTSWASPFGWTITDLAASVIIRLNGYQRHNFSFESGIDEYAFAEDKYYWTESKAICSRRGDIDDTFFLLISQRYSGGFEFPEGRLITWVATERIRSMTWEEWRKKYKASAKKWFFPGSPWSEKDRKD